MPQAAGEAKVESKTGRLEIDAKLNGMEPASKFGLEYLTYVLWAITPEGRANNLAEVVLDNGKSEMHATTDLQAFGLIITAEPYFAVTQPSDHMVAQDIIRSDKPFFQSAQEVVHFDLHFSGDVGIIVIFEHDLACGDLSRVFGLKTALH